VTGAPPSEITFPPVVAPFEVIEVTPAVVMLPIALELPMEMN